MFNYEFKGDYNVTRKTIDHLIKIYDSEMNLVVTFSGDIKFCSYGTFIAGLTHGNADLTLFDLDTGKFIIGDVGQLAEESAA